MRFKILSDTTYESGISEVVYELSGPTEDYLRARDYGPAPEQIAVVLMCRSPSLKFRRRVKYVKKSRSLYLDVILHLPDVLELTHDARRLHVMARVVADVSETLEKYAFPGFDRQALVRDVQEWFRARAT